MPLAPGNSPGAGGVTLDHDRLDLGGVDLTGLSREDVLAALTDAALEAFDELGPADFADGDPSGHWVTLEEGEHVFLREGKVYATREAIEHLARGKPPPDTPAPHHPLRPAGGKGVIGPQAANAVLRSVELRTPQEKERDAGVESLKRDRREAAERKASRRRGTAKVVEDHPEAARIADEAHARHLARAASATTPEQHQASYQQYEWELTAAGVVPTRTGYGFKKGRKASSPAGFAAPLRPVRFTPYHPDAEFYSPDQPRDDRGRWTAGGEGAAPQPTQADRAALRQASLAAVRAYVRAGGEPTHVEHEQLAAHLARLTVDQLHAVKVEHGLKASGRVKSDLVARLAERFRLHRAKQEPAGRKALAEAVAGREGWHAPRDVMGGHAALHGPTGARVRADSAGTMFDVLAPGSELHSSHATAGGAVRAAEASGRFGTGGTTAEREHAARQEAIAKSRERAAQAKPAGQSAAGLAPEVVAQHRAPYKGAPLDNSHAQEQLGFPKALETLRSWPSDKLQAERRDLLRSSYGMFGQNAKKLLAVVEQVIRERQALQSARHAPAAAPPAPAGGVPTKPPTTLAQLRQAHPNVDFQVIGKGRTSLIDITFGVTPEERRRWAGSAAASGSPTEVIPRLHRYLESIHGPSSAPFSDAGAPLRPVRFVPLVQPSLVAEFAPGGQDDACR